MLTTRVCSSTSHDQRIVVLDFTQDLDTTLFT
jgi:hypothetical protein